MGELVLLVGISGSGKSSYARQCADLGYTIVSSDAIRAEILGNENDQSKNPEVFKVLHERVIHLLRAGGKIVYDATNLSAKRRTNFLKTIKHIDCRKVCVVFATPIEMCVERDSKRSRSVGRNIILKQLKQFEMPHKYEGWDEIKVRQVERGKRVNLFKELEKTKGFAQDNPYHQENLSTHMADAANLSSKLEPSYLTQALLIHDIGKLYTKTFYNTHGEKTDYAHFYGHANVSSYIYLCSFGFNYEYAEDKLILDLIAFHMQPKFPGYEHWKKKMSKYFDEEFFKDLEKMDYYDKKASRNNIN